MCLDNTVLFACYYFFFSLFILIFAWYLFVQFLFIVCFLFVCSFHKGLNVLW